MKAERLHAPSRKGQNVSEIRSTEPKPIYDVISETIADIMKRANKYYETATPTRETAMAKPNPAPRIDYEVSDVVQIRAGSKSHIGDIGVIIGARYMKLDKGGDAILYTVKFSDKDAADFVANNLKLVRAGNGVI